MAYIAFEPFPNAKGSGTRITNMTEALVRAGLQVELITLPGQTAERVPQGVHHRPIQVRHENFLQRALAFRDRVARELEAVRPDVVHFRGIFEGQAALTYAQRRGLPAVFEVNGLPSVELVFHYPSLAGAPQMQGKLRRLEQHLLQTVEHVLTQSETTLGFLRGRGLPERTHTQVIPNGAVLGQAPPSRSPGGPRVLYAGTLAPWQGVAELLMATRRCVQVQPELRVVLAGPVRKRWQSHLDRLVRRLKIGPWVEFTGALSRSELATRVADSDVCVAPLRRDARNRHQGCSPIKLYEYMAAARPVITTDLPCVREIVSPERGVLLPVTRPKVLASAMLELLDDPVMRARLGCAGRAYIAESAQWSVRQAQLEAFYTAVV